MFISVNDTPNISYNSTLSEAVCADAVEPPAPLVKDDKVVPDNEPVIISFPILTVMFPLPKPELLASVSEVALSLIVADSVVSIPEDTPVTTTLLDVWYIPWSSCLIFNVVEPLVMIKGFDFNLFTYTVFPISFVIAWPIGLFSSVTAPAAVVLNTAFLKVNLISSLWDAAHVLLFCDLNNTPRCGCLETILNPPISVSPILEIHILKSLNEQQNNILDRSLNIQVHQI